MDELEGKVAVVTGASSGIGKGIARAFCRRGVAVALAARDAERLRLAAQEASTASTPALAVPTDVTDEVQVEALFQRVMARFGRVDVLINNAGAFDGGPLETLGLDAWNRVLGACLTGTFLCTRAAFRLMIPAGGGRIINIGSISAQRPRLHSVPYTAAKHGVWGLTQAAALEGRDHHIVVSCVHPGNVRVERRKEEQGRRETGEMVVEADEPMMEVDEIARVVMDMAALPAHMNMLEAIVLPTRQTYLGRG